MGTLCVLPPALSGHTKGGLEPETDAGKEGPRLGSTQELTEEGQEAERGVCEGQAGRAGGGWESGGGAGAAG